MAAAGWPANKPETSQAPPVQASTPASAAPVQETPKSVVVFDELVIDGKLKPFIELTSSFAGAPVVEIVRIRDLTATGY